MAEEKRHVSPELLKNFVPLSQLTHDNLLDLAGKARLEALPAGRAIFLQGESDNDSFYLVSGEVVLEGGTPPNKVVAAGSPAARFRIDHHKPRQLTARARTDVRFLRIDNDLLDIHLTWDQNAYMVSDIAEEEGADEQDWMTNILRSDVFHRIPPMNIQKIFIKMRSIAVKRGTIVIKQGGEGDYYYYLDKGRCLVTRDTPKGVIKLAELEAGSAFGEEALISGARRNANVTMLSDGVVVRLAKEDFESLLKEPVLKEVTLDEVKALVAGGAVLLDVRLENEHKNYALPRSLHIPLYLLRIKSAALDKSRKYIVYCDTGRRSSSAAYLLSERGFDACVIKGGLMSMKPPASGQS